MRENLKSEQEKLEMAPLEQLCVVLAMELEKTGEDEPAKEEW
jgi:hypothetical protein